MGEHSANVRPCKHVSTLLVVLICRRVSRYKYTEPKGRFYAQQREYVKNYCLFLFTLQEKTVDNCDQGRPFTWRINPGSTLRLTLPS